MTRSLFSPFWHSVAELKPRLIPQANIHRHVYRDQVWYVVQDQGGGRYHRLSQSAYAIVAGMDGTRTVEALLQQANETGGEDACTQNDIVDLMVQLHAADLLQADVTPDSAVLFERYKKKRKEKLKQWLMNPLSLRIPLLDPEPFLNQWAPMFYWCFSKLGLVLWLLVVVPALVLAGQHWNELTNGLSDKVLSSSNLLVMALVYPIVKLLHELGHAVATKVWGGSVHELGLMFLVFAPVPYVDASSSSSFPSKYQRAIVAAAGMLTELVLAAVAMYVWLLTEPGIVRAVAFNTMFIAGVSTLAVNGNPLLRYDGYYILSDLIEIPNLAQRGQKYCAYLWDRYVFGAIELEPPHDSAQEKYWLATYTPLAWCYRLFVTISITMFVASEFFIFGILFAFWGAFTAFVMPLWKAYKHVVKSPTLQRRRSQAIKIALGMMAGVFLFAFACPMPLSTQADGVVWLPDQAILHAGGNGFFQHWLVPPGSKVIKGMPLYVLEDRALAAELEVNRGKVEEAEANLRTDQFDDPVKAVVSARRLEQEQEVLRRMEERAAKLTGDAEADGTLIAVKPQDMPGQYFKKGELIGYVLETNQLIARVAVSQNDIDLVRTKFGSAEMRMASRISDVYPIAMARELTAGVDQLPTPALSLSGGGRIPTLPNDQEGLKTIERVFLIDFHLTPDVHSGAFGERVHVRFNHGYEPIAIQGLRRLRQLFLSRFGV